MNRRTPWHDYRAKGLYMLTMVVTGRAPLLGRLVGDGLAPRGSADAARVEMSALGKAIYEREVLKISAYYPMVEVWKLCVMPDHIHMIVQVKEDLPEGKHLGQIVRGFKTGCSRAWWALLDKANEAPCGKPQGTGAATVLAAASSVAASAPSASSPSASAPVPAGFPAGYRPVLFEPGYNDKILLHDGQLENWKHYLDDNPRRLAIKRQCPNYFLVIHHVRIGDFDCHLVGNRFLLDIPEKAAVIVHKAYTDLDFENYRRQWLAIGEAGGVLVGTSIAPREKIVMQEAFERGYRIILLRPEGFPPLYKPSGRAFDASSDGRLLQISPWEYQMSKFTVAREQCLQLNRLAELLANT
jgi:hypothetical protein